MATLKPLSLKSRALRHLAAREHSRAELERKLRGPDTDAGELARTLDELEAKGFISAERVAESVMHRRSGRFGAARIRRETGADLRMGVSTVVTSGNVAELADLGLFGGEFDVHRCLGVGRARAPRSGAT